MLSLDNLSSARLLANREPHLREGFRVEASSTQFRRVLALVCATTSGHGVFPTLCSSAATFAKFCDRRKLCTIAISCSRRDAAQLHFDRAVTFGPEAKEPRFPQFSGACAQSNQVQKERSFHPPTTSGHWRCPWNTSPLPSCLTEHTNKTWNEQWGNLQEAGHPWRQHNHQDPPHSHLSHSPTY